MPETTPDGNQRAAVKTMPDRLSTGIDFGTTNTVVAMARPGQKPRAIAFRDGSEWSDIYRSVLCFEQLSASRFDIEAHAGMQAIRAYLNLAHETRFLLTIEPQPI